MPAVDPVRNTNVVRKRKVKRKPRSTAPPISGDQRDRMRAARDQQLRESVPKTPDQADRKRSPQQQARDRAVVNRVVRETRERAVAKRNRGSGTRAVKRVLAPRGRVIDATKQFEESQARSREQRAVRLAPVLKVLDQTTRPLHAVAGATDAAVQGRNVPKAAVRGIKNEDKTTFSTVLRHAGVKNKVVRGVAGFGLDIVADPLTYATGGTGSVAEKLAAKEASKAAAAATAAGLTKKQVKKAASTAARGTYARNSAKGAGVTVKFAGREIPGVRRATAAARRGGGKAAARIVPERTRNAVRDAASEVSPHVAPAGVSKKTHEAARDAARKARATTNRGQREAVNVAHGIKKQIGDKNYAAVVDAVESGSVGSLPADLQPHANTLRALLADIRSVQTGAGVKVPERKGYIPRKLTPETIKAEQKKASRVGGRGTTQPGSSMARKENRTMAQLRADEPGRYREDLHALLAERLAEGHASAARANLAQDIAKLGRSVPRGTRVHLGDREALYKVRRGRELQETSPTDKKFLRPGNGKARYVVLNRTLVDRTMGTVGAPTGGAIMHGYDKTQAGFKRLALATPGFHVRNLIGDTSQAYVHQPGYKLPANMVRAGRVLKAAGRDEKAQRKLAGGVPAGKGTLKTKRYGDVTYEDAARKLIDAGAARSGYTARELRELSRSGSKKIRAPKSPAAVRRAFLNREDLPRLATAIHALRDGATYEEAARKVADVHFDYAELTPFERNIARRILPFYTWTARNVPLQAKSIATKPGKYAAYQKVREEAALATRPDVQDPEMQRLYQQLTAAGVKFDGGWQKYLTEYEQRNAGVPVSWKGHKFTVSAGLPLADLNELPGAARGGQASEYMNKAASLVTPIVKDPVEFGFNYSFFFRDQVERDNSPLVAAPSVVGSWPEWAKRKFGVVKAQDKRSGKMVWQWPGRADYVAHAIPGLVGAGVKMATPGHDRQGKGTVGKALSLAGIKATPVDATSNAVNLAYARGQEIQKRQAMLRQQRNPANGELIGAKNPTPEYTRLAGQLKIVTQIAYQGKAKRGDKVLPPQGGPPKPRGSSRRVQVPGVTGRVKVPGSSSGRVKVPTG